MWVYLQGFEPNRGHLYLSQTASGLHTEGLANTPWRYYSLIFNLITLPRLSINRRETEEDLTLTNIEISTSKVSFSNGVNTARISSKCICMEKKRCRMLQQKCVIEVKQSLKKEMKEMKTSWIIQRANNQLQKYYMTEIFTHSSTDI